MSDPRAIDLRSDTVTQPTDEMRRAMAEAVVGDDVLGDDPTVKELEAEFARVVGKPAAMFVPSGSMANLCAVLVHCRPGDEAVMEERTHTFKYEGGGAARFGGVSIRTYARASGIPEVSDLLDNLRNPEDDHQPRSKLMVVENTHNMAGGRIVPVARVAELAAAAHDNGLHIHMDGARMFNAAAALGVAPAAITSSVDSVMCCLSKGLGAPVGSLLAGPDDFIHEARRVRKALGGGMRQSGVLAAAGLLALESRSRLPEDHARARRLAEAIDEIDGLRVDVATVETNIVMVQTDGIDLGQLILGLKERGVRLLRPDPNRLRLITHRDVGDSDIDRAIECFREVSAELRSGRYHSAAGDPDAEPWNV